MLPSLNPYQTKKQYPVISRPNSPGKGGAHSMMTKPKAPTCHIEIRFLRMRPAYRQVVIPQELITSIFAPT
ncbi:MAG: hypothetical protein A2W85_13605 [Bacteroidetes bacterium GWF2_41_31]|nr:MAG: hypothetical protein A2W85_13605 [Bacteroidetes bacterium GWF2_41_31]OFZ08228.1 MAG: hypothetical protein A2338_04610 [Bacteroidetes bacterium RIFOXYB12_FULL_41_6]